MQINCTVQNNALTKGQDGVSRGHSKDISGLLERKLYRRPNGI